MENHQETIENIRYKAKYYRVLIAINEFNSWPWWKKAFFKFDIKLLRGFDDGEFYE